MATPERSAKSPAPQYLTPAEVATMLQVHPATVYRWAASDASMPATRVGRRFGSALT
jgi:excisionase family DNA binding protein